MILYRVLQGITFTHSPTILPCTFWFRRARYTWNPESSLANWAYYTATTTFSTNVFSANALQAIPPTAPNHVALEKLRICHKHSRAGVTAFGKLTAAIPVSDSKRKKSIFIFEEKCAHFNVFCFRFERMEQLCRRLTHTTVLRLYGFCPGQPG